MTLTDHQRLHLVHCLRVAASQFDEDAKAPAYFATPAEAGFMHYAAETRRLADMLEDAQSVEVKP